MAEHPPNTPHTEMRTGRPDTAKPPILLDYVPQNLKDELFEEEWEALQELKQNEIANHFSDRFLAAFLLARKLNIKRTKELLKTHIKWRKDHGYDHLPTFESLNKDLLKSDFGLKVPGARDKSGCGLLFCKMSKMVPDNFKNFDVEMTNWVIWNTSQGNLFEDMDFHRNGLTFIFDLSDIGWKNVDLGLQKRINAALMDNFPMRVTKVFIVNPPAIFKTLLAAARLFLKKKLTDRIQVTEMEDLKLHVDVHVMPEYFGGTNQYTAADFIQFVERMYKTYPDVSPHSTSELTLLNEKNGVNISASKKKAKGEKGEKNHHHHHHDEKEVQPPLSPSTRGGKGKDKEKKKKGEKKEIKEEQKAADYQAIASIENMSTPSQEVKQKKKKKKGEKVSSSNNDEEKHKTT